jgi:uncharacterized protein YejL (UPF0352 family)
MKKNIFIGGAHRGGRSITQEALNNFVDTYRSVVIADPKEKRAEELALEWRRAGVASRAMEEPCEEAIEKLDSPVDAALLSIDTINPMKEVLERHKLPTQWQLMVRGLGVSGALIGLSGSIPAGENKVRELSEMLIGSLGRFIQPTSSLSIRDNPLNADILHTLRKFVSYHSVKRVELLNRDPDDIPGGSLNFFWGDQRLPLIIEQKSPSQKVVESKRQALEAEIPHQLEKSKSYATALVSDQNVDFFVVDQPHGRRFVRLHVPLVHSLPAPANQAGVGSAAALFALAGIALWFPGGKATPAAMAAAVTD